MTPTRAARTRPTATPRFLQPRRAGLPCPGPALRGPFFLRAALATCALLTLLAPAPTPAQPPASTGVCPYAFLRPTLGEGGAAGGALTVAEAEHTLIDNLAALCTATPAEAFPTACPAGSPLEGDGAGGLLCGTDDTGPASAVASVFGRTGAVTAAAGDYTAAQIPFTDPGAFYTATHLDAALQEIGTALATPQPATHLADATTTSVDATSTPADGDVLTYSAATTQATWSPPPTGTGGGTGGTGTAGSTLLLYARDEQPSATKGGDGTAGTWNPRTLNTLVYSDLPGATLAAGQLTLPAGSYTLTARAPAARVNSHRLRLWSVTGSAVLATGTTAFSDSGGDGDQTDAHLFAVLTLAAPTTVELQHWIASGSSLVGGDLGVAAGDGSPEIYTEVWVRSLP